MKTLLNLIFARKCIKCGMPFLFDNQNLICEDCISKIEKLEINFCKSCGISLDDKCLFCDSCKKERLYEYIYNYTTYYHIKEIITEYKISKIKSLSKTIADVIKEDIINIVKQNNVETILYIPLSEKIMKKRGFNHLYEILINIFPKYMIKDFLIKTKETKFQMELNKEERNKNLINAFSLMKDAKFYGENILIFDDVLTTGATLREIGYLLKGQNIGKMYGYVISKG